MKEILKAVFGGVGVGIANVIPGVSGSMILKMLGYYEPIVTEAIPGLLTGIKAGEWAAVGHCAGILIPFAIGIVVGIFAIAKLIEVLLEKWPGNTYMAILGLVCASPVAILLGTDMSGVNWLTVVISLATFAVGYAVAYKLSGEPEPQAKAEAQH